MIFKYHFGTHLSWCKKHTTYTDMIEALDKAEGGLLYITENDTLIYCLDTESLLREFARECALDVVHLWDAPEIVIRYLKTGDESIREDASVAARNAARNAASDAARAAANAAANAAAASAAARAAASAAAWAAAWTAAGGAAWAAVMTNQSKKLEQKVFSKIEVLKQRKEIA